MAIKLLLALHEVAKWFNDSYFTLNKKKTVMMYFAHEQKQIVYTQLSVNGQIIKNINEVKYLGMILD